jgi:Tol biopolymer transport system component
MIQVVILLSLFGFAALPALAQENHEARFLERIRQLTFEGKRAGEGYYSPDGDRLVFQSEREPGNPFYQIYELDLTTGDTRRVSPGTGKTTCSFIRPGHDQIVFASTHHDPRSLELQKQELELRASGKERRYSWDYDPEMELYVEMGRGGTLKRLTNAQGYDAEASYSPDGEWIVFASNRAAYSEELDDEDAAKLEVDPSYFIDLYRMRADGSDLQRLTRTPGYDGGPFFSADGNWIVWRRFDAEGLTAEIMVAHADGSDARAVTSFGAMSWAPYMHPSGKYIVFTTNKQGFSNFELYLVDFAGEKEPVRVTWTDGFDGLPVPTPDGKELTWTSNRRGPSQLFTARWNHQAALEALAEAPPRQRPGITQPED